MYEIGLRFYISYVIPICTQGSPAFVWDNEAVRTDQPYADKRYHVAHNPPPNEVNFVNGLGKTKGNQRSQVYFLQ